MNKLGSKQPCNNCKMMSLVVHETTEHLCTLCWIEKFMEAKDVDKRERQRHQG